MNQDKDRAKVEIDELLNDQVLQSKTFYEDFRSEEDGSAANVTGNIPSLADNQNQGSGRRGGINSPLIMNEERKYSLGKSDNLSDSMNQVEHFRPGQMIDLWKNLQDLLKNQCKEEH